MAGLPRSLEATIAPVHRHFSWGVVFLSCRRPLPEADEAHPASGVAPQTLTANCQSLAVVVSTVSSMSPPARSVRMETHGSGEASPAFPVQSGTACPSFEICIAF